MVTNKKDNIIIGCSRLGAFIAKFLCENGENVIMIDKDEKSFKKLSDDFSGYQIKADASDLSVLEEYGIKNCKRVIIMTDDDNLNLYLSQVSFMIYEVVGIYVRLSNNDKGKLLENTNINAIYPFVLSKEKFVEKFNNINGGE